MKLVSDGTLVVSVEDATKVTRVLVEDGKNGDLYYADRPQGEWIDSQGRPMRLYESYSANCSACGEWSEYLTEYCPHCGARMKGVGDE